MIIIYDFDGTLTPYSLPQYEILKKCGYDDDRLMERIKKEIKKGNAKEIYDAYYKCYIDILSENGITISRDTACLGANQVTFNPGVVDYFKRFQSQTTGMKHYIVTAGIKDYVEETPISNFINGAYGVTFKQENGKWGDIDFLLTDKEKVNIIKKVQNENEGTNDIIYFGDGLTDNFAFEYVHSIGGKNVFIKSNEESQKTYQKLNVNGMIDECFDADFKIHSDIDKYIQKQLENQKDLEH